MTAPENQFFTSSVVLTFQLHFQLAKLDHSLILITDFVNVQPKVTLRAQILNDDANLVSD